MSVVARGNVATEASAFDRRRLRVETVRWMKREGCSHALSLNADRQLTTNKLSRMFGGFCLDIDRACLGKKNVYRVPSEDRLFGIAFVEHPETNIHLHAALRLAGWWPESSTIPMHVTLNRAWLRITGGAGSTLLKDVRDDGWGYYITKAVDLRQGQFLLTSDYHPQH